jgi:hypothetical protein
MPQPLYPWRTCARARTHTHTHTQTSPIPTDQQAGQALKPVLALRLLGTEPWIMACSLFTVLTVTSWPLCLQTLAISLLKLSFSSCKEYGFLEHNYVTLVVQIAVLYEPCLILEKHEFWI